MKQLHLIDGALYDLWPVPVSSPIAMCPNIHRAYVHMVGSSQHFPLVVTFILGRISDADPKLIFLLLWNNVMETDLYFYKKGFAEIIGQGIGNLQITCWKIGGFRVSREKTTKMIIYCNIYLSDKALLLIHQFLI